MPGIMCLPPEIMLWILGLLPAEELLDNVWNVCSAWRELVRHLPLWDHYVYASADYPSCQEVAKFVQKCPMLKHIRTNVMTFNDLDILITAVVGNCSDVRTFCVTKGTLTASQIDVLFEAFPNLEAFTVTVDCQDPPPVVERICKFTNLKELNMELEIYGVMSYEPIMDGSVHILHAMKDRLTHLTFTIQLGSQRAVDTLGLFSKLESLTLFHDSDYTTLMNFLPLANIKTLKSLQFETNVYEYSDVDTIFDSLFSDPLPLLHNLGIIFSHCELPETVVTDICRCYPNLKALELYGDCQTHTFDNICALEQLESLKYNCFSLTDEATAYIARCPRLKVLDVENCSGITDVAIANLVNCTSLESLNLGDCSIPGRTLHLIPKHLKKLRYLNVVGTEAEQKDLAALVEQMPSAKIVY